jgi:hypothetical protein
MPTPFNRHDLRPAHLLFTMDELRAAHAAFGGSVRDVDNSAWTAWDAAWDALRKSDPDSSREARRKAAWQAYVNAMTATGVPAAYFDAAGCHGQAVQIYMQSAAMYAAGMRVQGEQLLLLAA